MARSAARAGCMMTASAKAFDLDRLKASLLGEDVAARTQALPVTAAQCAALLKRANKDFRRYLSRYGHTVESYLLGVGREAKVVPVLVELLNHVHRDVTPDTMVDRATVEHLQACIDTVLRDGVPGDL